MADCINKIHPMQQNLILSSLSETKVARSTKVPTKDMHKIGSSKDAETVLRLLCSSDIELREKVNRLFLNRENKVTGWFPVSKGGISGTVVDMKLVFSVALKCLASGIIVAHNHPSGNLKPSESDLS